MTWRIDISSRASKTLAKLDNRAKQKITAFLTQQLPNMAQPRQTGKALQGNLSGLWRYRVGDYRIITQIKDNELIILVIEIDHRKDIYR